MDEWLNIIVEPDEVPDSKFHPKMPKWLRDSIQTAWRTARSRAPDPWLIQGGIVSLAGHPGFTDSANRLVEINPASKKRIASIIEVAPALMWRYERLRNRQQTKKIEAFQEAVAHQLERVSALIRADVTCRPADKYMLTKSERAKIQFQSNSLIGLLPKPILIGRAASVSIVNGNTPISRANLVRLAVEPIILSAMMKKTADAIRATLEDRKRANKKIDGLGSSSSMRRGRDTDVRTFLAIQMHNHIAGGLKSIESNEATKLQHDLILYLLEAVHEGNVPKKLSTEKRDALRKTLYKARKSSVAKSQKT